MSEEALRAENTTLRAALTVFWDLWRRRYERDVRRRREVAALRAENERLRAVLRMVRADRPSGHSDVVWLAVCAATEETI